ncbi:hypothetical protein E3T54_11140 [Cryobacterium sp. Sr8]|uniref:SRPBCC domain-containing protein n=1 Tax=Cryobacterium sp. Sr8 TaxID=1259203 RepID=UPI00106991AB|nr:SRPBCC domain-containing protein [Cryobacterium sp. Sr8]TFD76119.1 hypothetical protein E3T54_11140 [Cryobacterium sp. Sr8]
MTMPSERAVTERKLTHSTFELEREYRAPVAKVFQAFADPAIKAKWFDGPEPWRLIGSALDIREGGREFNEG